MYLFRSFSQRTSSTLEYLHMNLQNQRQSQATILKQLNSYSNHSRMKTAVFRKLHYLNTINHQKVNEAYSRTCGKRVTYDLLSIQRSRLFFEGRKKFIENSTLQVNQPKIRQPKYYKFIGS